MSVNRIKVQYTAGNSRSPFRYLDTVSGLVYVHPSDGTHVQLGFTPSGATTWSNGVSTLEMVAGPDLPDPPPAVTPTSAVNPKTAQGNKKYSLRLLPLPADVEVNRALDDGSVKYGAANWREKGVPASVYIDAAQRHIKQWFDGGQERASDSDVHNLGHAMACLAIIIDAQWNGMLDDDRPFPCRDTDALLKREV